MWVTVWVTVSLVYMMFTAISMQWEAAKGWLTVFTHIQEVARPEIRTSKKSRIQEVAHPRNRVSRKPRSCVLNWLSVGMSVASYEASGRSDQTWGGDISWAPRRPRSFSSPPSHNSKAHLPLNSPRNFSSCTPYVHTSHPYTTLHMLTTGVLLCRPPTLRRMRPLAASTPAAAARRKHHPH